MPVDSITDFLLTILTTIAAIIGFLGKTFDEEKKRPTGRGWTLIILSLLSFGTASWVLYRKNEAISQRKEISDYAKAQIIDELKGLMTPVLYNDPQSLQEPELNFDLYKDTLYLRNDVFNKSVFGSHFFRSRKRKDSEFVSDSLAIQKNQDLLNQTISNYSSYLDGEILKSISEIFSDGFYNKYALRGFGDAFDRALVSKLKNPTIEEKKLNRMTSFGHYYETYSIDKKTNPFQELSGLIVKFEDLYNKVSK